MANGSMLFIPSNGANIVQGGQLIPGTVIPSGGVIQYGGQQPGNSNSQPEQNPQQRVQEKLRKVETKTLGAIQIIIGLMHIGFGGVSAVLVGLYYIPLAVVALYPFWGGIFFIASGSLSVSAENPMCASLVKCSVGMNITSAVMALIGMILYIAELAINSLLAMARHPGEKATDTTMLIPPIDANIIQEGRVIPGTIIQPVTATQYTNQLHGSLNNHPQQSSPMGLWEKLHKVESSTLGAVQIIIGLIHIGFGSVSAVLWNEYRPYIPLATHGAYPFWGGAFFIASGSLSVSAENVRNTCLVQCSVGMNITSAIMALIGAILYTTELITNLLDLDYYLTESVGFGLGFLLLIFSLLEFCITVSTAHFGCQATCCKNDMTIVVVPYTIIRDGVISGEDVPAEANLSHPAHDNANFCP
ncbi:membrane-spanning 4-domains subfamily A member 8-like [Eublepharis macularius]|uniref:Membrane-spanning 4-domains subfamily A member 8-like n=1 Tax=Eublepharis macularius TaxID=481883 RepID=A0AA97IUU2_EUBMA|nr:membrane-spanning 4-domains subfamily A member 8-like [Eublepharis macularius]